MNSLSLKKKRIQIPDGAEGYLYVSIKPHKEFNTNAFYLKIVPGMREVKLPDGLNPKKVVRAWISPVILPEVQE